MTAKKKASSAADEVDSQLARYRSMRDFGVTAEPAGGQGKKAGQGLPFVIQKHAASHLHYDLRLGWNGVLKSWAVAKGPSYSTKDRRLAVQVEDHPMEYGGFEGTIPKGQYGGGTVMVWDQGTWAPQAGHEDVDAGLREGSLKFTMDGGKMHGKWTLVRMNGKAAGERKPNWLLIKEHDRFERGADDKAVTDELPKSAVTGRTLEEIGAEEDHIWNSRETAKPGQAWLRKDGKVGPAKTGQGMKLRLPKAAKKEQQPEFVKPQLAMEADSAPERGDWLHELKLDGYRVQARKAGGKVALLTRSGLDWTHRMPAVAAAVGRLLVETATLDGEVVVLGEDGNADFARLQAAFQQRASQNDGRYPLVYFAFDLLHVDGYDLRGLPLRERKALLAQIVPPDDETLRVSGHLEGSGRVMFEHACRLHAEGIISKQAEAGYRSGRGADWLKSKCLHEQEFVVGGYTLSSDGDDRVGSLLLGYYDGRRLLYAGRTGTGFTQTMKRELLGRLEKLAVPQAAFAAVPLGARRGAHWVRPELVAQVRFATWTAENLVRQAAFLGLREDKSADEVVREEVTVAPTPKRPAVRRMPAPVNALAVRLTHPEKVLDAESGLTKQELADYYAAIAPHLLPQIEGRPLSLVRCPEGTGRPCFFQKHGNKMLPPGIGTVQVPDKKTGEREAYITLEGGTATAEALASLAQMGVMELHPWGSRNGDLEHPDRLILDLDPDELVGWQTLCGAAEEVRRRLKKAGLVSFLKLTGGKGLHVVVPMKPGLDWAEVKALAHRFVSGMERQSPQLYLTKMSKAARKGRIYLDYLRNERGATAVAAFSPRARAGAHVSLPLPWAALKLAERPVFKVHEFAEWKGRLRADPWKAMLSTRQELEAGMFDGA